MTTAGAGGPTKGEATRKTAIAIGGPCATARIAKLNARNRGWNTWSKPARIGGETPGSADVSDRPDAATLLRRLRWELVGDPGSAWVLSRARVNPMTFLCMTRDV